MCLCEDPDPGITNRSSMCFRRTVHHHSFSLLSPSSFSAAASNDLTPSRHVTTIPHPICTRLRGLSLPTSGSQIYFKLSNIQNSNRRVVLVHSDESSLIRIMATAHRLKLFDRSRFWFLLDGVIGHRLASPAFPTRLNLPTGVLALHQKSLIQQPATLYAILNLLQDVALTLRTDAANTSIDQSELQPRISCLHSKASPSRQDLSNRLYR